MIHNTLLSTIGNTPLVRINSLPYKNLMVKLESCNPGGSVKDRPALNMIEQAEARGDIQPGDTLVEPTSGNTGIGIALVAAAKGYNCVFTMADSFSLERRKILQAYGAQLVLTPGAKGMTESIAVAKEIAKKPRHFMLQQFENFDNSAAHKKTGEEIWNDTDGNIDILVCASGTGGTVSGTGKFLREKNPNLAIVTMEPKDSPVLSGGKPGPHKIQGSGPNFVPKILTTEILDIILQVSTQDAYTYTNILARKEGILAGVSSGAVLYMMHEIAKDPHYAEKNIVGILPDTGERYLSTEGLWDNE